MFNSHFSRFMLPVCAALLASALLVAQSDLGSISGYIKDPSGAVVPNARVTIKNQTGLARQATTNESGYYTITNIPPGLYDMRAEATGFKRYESTNNKLDPSSNLVIDATLALGAATETVEVTAEGATLQTESASVQKVVTREQIDALELNGRNPIFMANLVPGTRGGNLSGLSFSFSQGPSNINGARTQDSLITYDGAPAVRTRSNGTSLGSADVDSTQEIQILTATYSPEYGRSSGGQIRILTKSGTNQFHGSAYEYLRNTAFNANTWTRNHTAGQDFVPPFHYNQFGYYVGGPFYIPGKFNTEKNKIFWFWGQEWVRYRYTDTSSWTVPSLLMRQGNFSELLNPSNVYYNKAVVIKDPNTGVPFPNNIIPQNMLSPSGLGILKAYPVPNLTTPINGSQFFYIAALHPQNQRKDTLSADLNITDKQRVQFRRMNYSFFEYQPLDGTPGETPKYFNRPNQTSSLSHVWTISPTKVNEFLATVSLDDVYIPVDRAHFLDRTTVGINYPYIFPQGKLIPTRIPTANITNFNGLTGGPYPSHSSGPIFDISDSFTSVMGNHTLKFGYLFERSGENDNDEINVSACPTCTNNQNGQFNFTDTRSGHPSTGVAAANAAMGLFDTYSELGQRAYTIFRGSMHEAFAQDSWKVTQKLHVDYGFRYSVIVPYSAQWRNMIVFDPAFYDPAKAVQIDPKTGAVIPGSGDRYNGMVIPGSGWPSAAKGRFPEADVTTYNYLFRGVNSHYSDIQWGDIQPRVGIAYEMTPKTVIRAGAGRFFTRVGVSDSIFLGGNPPFQPTANVSFGNVDNPGGTSANSLPLTVTTQSKAFKNPEAWAWNFTVERETIWNSLLSVGYVARRGLHAQREADINQPSLAVVAANPGVNLDALRPYKGYNSIRETDNIASSTYNSLQVAWNRRFAKGLAFGIAYTLSKSMDNGSAQRDIIPDTYYAGNLWGQSDFDARHVFAANYLYDLPFFRGQNNLVGRLLGGWQISGITQLQTGTPCSVGVNNDYAGVGQDGSMSCTNQLWAMNGTPKLLNQFAANGSKDPHYWFSTTNSDGSPIYTAPAKGTFVLQKGIRNVIHSPGFENWNLGLFKSFAVNERSGFQFRAEAFDAFNHPNWGGANFNPTSSSFGKVTGKTNDARNLQLSLRFYF
ncbi:MAG TPA: carboxypeptidase regulatory-like domain-containing protein [Bryobacteraceae bacterium]|nr:carboxypeptidase regulatory-like domain-containing protein [Bryobacteraceae bacterium]